MGTRRVTLRGFVPGGWVSFSVTGGVPSLFLSGVLILVWCIGGPSITSVSESDSIS